MLKYAETNLMSNVCDRGYVKRGGHCKREGEKYEVRAMDFEPFKVCVQNSTCLV